MTVDTLMRSAICDVTAFDAARDASATQGLGDPAPVWQWRRAHPGHRQDLSYLEYPDPAVLPGQVASPAAIHATEERKRVLNLLARFQHNGLFQVAGRERLVSARAAAAACGLIKLLPYDALMPRVAPDDEGGVAAVWDSPDGTLLVVIDDSHLHIVVDATTPRARYHDQVTFQPDGMALPADLLAVLPRR